MRTSIHAVAAASLVGTAIEWYDFFLYGTAAALVFHRLFFPQFDPSVGTLLALGTFAVGFLARPLGGIVFGHLGDRRGRTAVLGTTLVLMGLATAGIGLLPTYDRIGAWAPLALVILRLVQGFGLGGEWGGAVLLAVEHAPRGRRGFYGSWPQTGGPLGFLLSTGAFALVSTLPERELLSWGWRIPFLASTLLVALGLFVRLRIAETPAFEAIRNGGAQARLPLLELLRSHRKTVLLAMGARFAENGLFYVYSTFVLVYATGTLRLGRQTILSGLLIATAIQLVALPMFGALSDRVGRRPVYMAGALFSALWAIPFFLLLGTRQTGLIWLAIVLALSVGHAAMYGPQASFFSELFEARVRYSGASLGYQLASVFAGGLSPVVASGLLAWAHGRPWAVTAYMIALNTITLACLHRSAETRRSELAGSAPATWTPASQSVLANGNSLADENS